MDANYGSVLLNDGKANFKWIDYEKSGFYVRNEIKHLGLFKDAKGKQFLIAAINNEQPQIFTFDD